MKIPPGTTEEEVVRIINKVVNMLAARFRFGCNDLDDMKQQGFLCAMKALEKDKYDMSRPLENFLYQIVRNGLINYKRDNYVRTETPCHGCVFFDPKRLKSTNQCAAFSDKAECKKLEDWKQRNETRKRLAHTVDIDSQAQTPAYDEDTASFKELEEMIDRELAADLRSDYLRMRQQQSIPKTRRKRVQEAILEIHQRYHGETETN